MLRSDDEGLRNIAANLLHEFASHGESLFSPVLLLLIAIVENVGSEILESDVVSPLVKMLQGDDKHLRSTAAHLLKQFASHGGSLSCSHLAPC
jgi:hypothetical protein